MQRIPTGEILHTRIGFYGSAPTCYLSLLARDETFQFNAFDDELYEQRLYGRIRAMRHTLFLLPKKWLPTAFQAASQRGRTSYQSYLSRLGITTGWELSAGKKLLEIKIGLFPETKISQLGHVQSAAVRIAAAVGAMDLQIQLCEEIQPLGPALKSRFKSPLKGIAARPVDRPL